MLWGGSSNQSRGRWLRGNSRLMLMGRGYRSLEELITKKKKAKRKYVVDDYLEIFRDERGKTQFFSSQSKFGALLCTCVFPYLHLQ